KMKELDECADFSGFKWVHQPIIEKHEVAYLAKPNPPLFRGHFEGHLFEMYVTNLFVLAVNALECVDWIIPMIGNQSSVQAPRKSGFGRGADGSIVMFREGRAYAEYDSILSIGGQLLIAEFKKGKQHRCVKLEDIDKRVGKLSAATQKSPGLLVIQPAGTIFPEEYMDRIEKDPAFIHLTLRGFDRFMEYYKKNKDRITIQLSLQHCKKAMDPTQWFKAGIDYMGPSMRLYRTFFDASISMDEFWNANRKTISLIGTLPIGIVTDPTIITPYLSDENSKLAPYLVTNGPFVLNLRGNVNMELTVEIVATKLSKKKGKGIPYMERWGFSLETNHFGTHLTHLSPLGYPYHQTRAFLKKVKDRGMHEEELSAIIARIKFLSGLQSTNQIDHVRVLERIGAQLMATNPARVVYYKRKNNHKRE
nr:hypothetical protein [Candidatus Sigynarchaeota archaeon]